MQTDPPVEIKVLAVKKTTVNKILDCGTTTSHRLCKSGELQTVRIGDDERVVVASIYRFIERGGEQKKAKPPAPVFLPDGVTPAPVKRGPGRPRKVAA